MKTKKPFRLTPKPFAVQRFDNNPLNYATVGTWVFITEFDTMECAQDFVDRANSPTQLLRVVPNDRYRRIDSESHQIGTELANDTNDPAHRMH